MHSWLENNEDTLLSSIERNRKKKLNATKVDYFITKSFKIIFHELIKNRLLRTQTTKNTLERQMKL